MTSALAAIKAERSDFGALFRVLDLPGAMDGHKAGAQRSLLGALVILTVLRALRVETMIDTHHAAR